MRFALIFPGQGSQSVGMGKALADAYPSAKAIFDEVDEALGEKLSDTIFNGPEETLTLTANAQPALMAVSLAALSAMESEGFDLSTAAFVAGHSLGEYSALAAAGTFTVTDTARLLRIRGNAMQAAVPVGVGAMAAIIGLDQDVLEKICTDAGDGDEACQIANDNGGGQLVISGHKSAVDRACALATDNGAKRAIPLTVSAPFHSTLMQPAAKAMDEALSDVASHAPKVPLVANVLASATNDPSVICENLVKQVTGRVRWAESVEYMAENGVTMAIEVGSGKVLTGLGRRITRDIKGMAVGTPENIASVLEALNA